MSLFDWQEPVDPGATLGGRAAAAPAPPGGAWTSLAVTIRPQEGEFWCWAAATEAVANYLQPAKPLTQCDVAVATLKRADCCARDPRHGPCDRTYYLERALAAVGRPTKITSGPLAEQTVLALLNANKPVGVRIGWRGGGGHFVLIGGYLPGPPPFVEVHDSAGSAGHGTSRVSLVDVTTAYDGLGTWTHSYETA